MTISANAERRTQVGLDTGRRADEDVRMLPDDIHRSLKDVFGFEQFRPGQADGQTQWGILFTY